MQETILSRLESSRKELLDLGLRNPLLNYRTSKARGLHIIQEKSIFIFDILVRQNKAMTFLGVPEKNTDDVETVEVELPQPSLEEAYRDNKLQTNDIDQKLQVKLLNTYYLAKTSIEEQGINTLFLALGMLNWYEAGNTEDLRQAPLLLIPVTLERSSANERFRLRYSGSEIGANLSLQAKMMADFQITLPDIPESDEFQLDRYFEELRDKVSHLSNWAIDEDAIELGFFSFGKFMIYHDLDSEKWPEGNKPTDHPNLKSLFEEGFKDLPPTATEDDYLDTETIANELFNVVDADSSQVLAMLAVNEGRNMVIQGPPGTGKSQTITNIIADAIGQGKKVLFVAEKMAALDVVKRRLDSINLGEACLELHSHKANKKELHEELKKVLDLGRPTIDQLQQQLLLLDEYRKELNEYCHAINTTIASSGLSPQKLIGFLLAISNNPEAADLPKISLEQIDKWDAEKMSRAEAMAERIQARLNDIDIPVKLLFWGSQLTMLLPHEQQAITQLLNSAHFALKQLQADLEVIAAEIGISTPKNRINTNKLIEWCAYVAKSPDLTDIDIKNEAWLLNQRDIAEVIETGKRFASLRGEYQNILIPEAWTQDVLEIRQNIIAYGDKWYKSLVGRYRKSNKQLASYCKSPLPDTATEKIKYIDAISECRQLENLLNELEPFAQKLFNRRWLKHRSDWNSLSAVASYLEELHQSIVNQTLPPTILNYLDKVKNGNQAAKYVDQVLFLVNEQKDTMNALLQRIQMDMEVRAPGTSLEQIFYQVQNQTVSEWIARFPEIQKVIAWNNLTKVAADENLSFLIGASLEWPDAKSNLKTAIQKTWYEYLIEQAFSVNPALVKFERASHEEVVEKFRKLDLLNLYYNRAKVALKHWEGVPRQNAGGQVNILKNEFNRKARLMPIRKLMQEAGIAIQAIKPVMMMSPMSIASFLAPGSIDFDLVIFDEASQVRPVEALGAILRGKQLVVVGDTKQLPPTSFFDKLNVDIEDEDNVTADIQSILGMCDAQGAPQRMLKWHYRSRHESLISLSNREFYESKLVIFPSPGSKYKMGLAFHQLESAIYDRGKTRTNPIEAEAVADAVIQHAINNYKQSLGVVAFSTAQMQAILAALEIRRRKYPQAENFFRSHVHEPFFVKNLENVQGDERDVIFISIGYGRVAEGTVPQSFGPLNNEGGERRLNVLITRAKLRCEIFTNINSEEIKITPTTKFGIRALKSFLYFAQHGRFEVNDVLPLIDKEPFEDQVVDQLMLKGYIIRKKVGSEAFYIDIAIVDENNPGRYILGIECDGEAYSSAKSARDRDRLRKQVLEGMGWRMFRIWSTDWFRNPKQELERLVAAIEKAKEATLLDDVEEEITVEETIAVNREIEQEEKSLAIPYQFTTLPNQLTQQELRLFTLGQLAGWITEIVNVEGPVHFDEMARRMTEAAGVAKLGSRIKYTLTQATRYAVQSGQIVDKDSFLWPAEMNEPVIRNRASQSSTSKKLHYIAPEEMSLAIKYIVADSIAISPEAAVPLIAKLFGFARVTEEMKNYLLEAIEVCVLKHEIAKDGQLLREIKQS